MPDASLYELRFPVGATNEDVHTGNMGVGCIGAVGSKTQINIKPWRGEGLPYPSSNG